VVVVPDDGGEGEDALQDADGHAAGGAAVVPFKVELALKVSLIDSMTCLTARRPTAGRQGASCGESFSRSSVLAQKSGR
jgi:hypothetical protein